MDVGEQIRGLSMLGETFLVCRRWFSCSSGAASLSIAIFRAVVNHDDSARTAVTLRCGLLVPFLKRRRVYYFSRYTALASWADLSLMLSCSSCMRFGLGTGQFLKAAWTSNVTVGCSVWSKQRHVAFLPIYCELDESLVLFRVVLVGVCCANHYRLRHLGWEKRGHGPTSRPWETSSVAFSQ